MNNRISMNMTTNGKWLRTLLLCSWWLPLLTACSDESTLHEAASIVTHGDMTVTFRIGIESADGGRSLSRANTDDPYTGPYDTDDRYAPGTAYENTINRLTLFVQDMGADGQTPGAIQSYHIGTEYPFLPFVGNDENQYLYVAKQQLDNVPFGKKRIYVAANLSDAQIAAFVSGKGPDAVYQLPGRELTIGNDLASANGMAMCCTRPAEHTYTLDDTDYECTFHLRRLAAKVLVTAVTDETGEFAITDGKAEEKPAFQVRLKDISYVVNSLNTATYLFQHIKESTAEDPNYGWQDTADAFVYHPIYSWVNYSNFFQPALRYDETRVPGGDNTSDPYTEGIYCPENTFSTTDGNEPDDKEQQITHVIIRAKLVPLKLYIIKQLVDYIESNYRGDNTTLISRLKKAKEQAPADEELFFFPCENQAESELIRGFSLLYENYSGLTDQAFFCDTEGNFYTYGAAKYKEFGTDYKHGENNTTQFTDMIIHAQGYAYYGTYLGNTPNKDIDNGNEETWKDSQVYRNTYYILHINRFLKPGSGVDPNQKYIEVHTEVIPFRPSWKGHISIDDQTPSTDRP